MSGYGESETKIERGRERETWREGEKKWREKRSEIKITCLLVVVVGFGEVENDIELAVASREVVDAENDFKLNEDVEISSDNKIKI